MYMSHLRLPCIITSVELVFFMSFENTVNFGIMGLYAKNSLAEVKSSLKPRESIYNISKKIYVFLRAQVKNSLKTDWRENSLAKVKNSLKVDLLCVFKIVAKVPHAHPNPRIVLLLDIRFFTS